MAASTLDVETKYELITRRLNEVLGSDWIKAILAEGRNPKCYWGECSMLLVDYGLELMMLDWLID